MSDEYARSDNFADTTVPSVGSFADMVALKGTEETGDGINKVIGRLAEAGDVNRHLLKGVIDQADFNDEEQARRGQGDAGRSHQTRRGLRGARLSGQPRPRRRPAGRCVRGTSTGDEATGTQSRFKLNEREIYARIVIRRKDTEA